jgi:ABC-type uncharacterized transport system substrate-binding protein
MWKRLLARIARPQMDGIRPAPTSAASSDAGREKAAAAELVRSTPDMIVVAGWTALAELQRLTSTIPVVFAQVSDPGGSCISEFSEETKRAYTT